jgi:hypothetical protein
MLDERSKRKPNFDERNAAEVELADGQTWFVPKPWLEIRPVFRGGKAVRAWRVLTCGPALDALIDALSECNDLDGQVMAAASLAAHLLRWHYELTDAELDQLLAFRCTDESSLNWMREVFAIATGRSGPKVSSAGSG